jgi:hypothetical protein
MCKNISEPSRSFPIEIKLVSIHFGFATVVPFDAVTPRLADTIESRFEGLLITLATGM